ncbi:SDR family NAD(P)-dependent oxidoreductase [Streptomyces aureus]|uniref:SDR family NAD(P)-dependent oxidoreductase n=1 Tax=Streptomyces aureus TaxID=193461 RepID=A0ABV4SM41_9ACTN
MNTPAPPGALVTGGTSGIGRAIVERLCSDGFRTAFTGRDVARGLAVADSTGAAFIAADSTNRQAIDRAVDESLSWLRGRLDVLVNNAAIVYEGPLESTPDDVFDELFEVNVTAARRYASAAFTVMRDQHSGVIVNIASDSAITGIAKLPAYSVTKAALLSLSDVLAAEGAPHGIRCNAVCPGATHPGMRSTATGFASHAENDAHWAPAPSGRHGQAGDVAAVVAWLASPDAAHVSGATLRVDGAASAALRGVTRS